jgi:phosphoglycolate phosphatase
MLILFDVDATLISTSGAGIRAMGDAGRDLFGPTFTTGGIEFAGRLDPLIIGDMFDRSGIDPTPPTLARFRQAYQRHLLKRLADPTTVARALPGVPALLDALTGYGGCTLGLLTGNFAETGSLKLLACGVSPARFAIHVWGDESPSTPPRRQDLPAVGMRRYRERFGRELEGSAVTIVGDTPHDVACAKAHGCRSLAVATGSFGVESLGAAGADRVVADLSPTDEIVRWLVRA